jgi:hypothetical protein
MRERRVGVTARSRQIEGTSLQIASEIAAPLELRTPTSTAAKAAIRVRMEAWRTMALESMGQKANPKRVRRGTESGMCGGGERRADARMRRCLILRQGASPLRPRPPFPRHPCCRTGGDLSRVRKPRKNGAPLTDGLRSEEFTEMRERGPSAKRAAAPVGVQPRTKVGNSALRAHEALPQTPPGGKPPETPGIFP